MKKYLGLVLGSLLLAGCGMADFNGSRTGNESQFLMEYTIFNTTDSQLLELKKESRYTEKLKKYPENWPSLSNRRERLLF